MSVHNLMNMFQTFKCFTFLMALSNLVIAQELDPQKNSNFERELNIRDFINLKVYSGIEVKLIP